MTAIIRHDQPPIILPITIGNAWCELTTGADHAGPETTILCTCSGVTIRARNDSEDEEYDHLDIDRLTTISRIDLLRVTRCRVIWMDTALGGETIFRVDFSRIAIGGYSRQEANYFGIRAFGILAGLGQPLPAMHGHNTEPPYNLGLSEAEAAALREGMARPAPEAFFDASLGEAHVPSPSLMPFEGEEDETYTVEVERNGSSPIEPGEVGVGIRGETLEWGFATVDSGFVRHLVCPQCGYRVQLTYDFVINPDNEFRWEHLMHYARCSECRTYGVWRIDDVPRAGQGGAHFRLDHGDDHSIAWCGVVASDFSIVRRPSTRHRPDVCRACVEAYKQAVSNQLAVLRPPPPKAPRRLDLNP